MKPDTILYTSVIGAFAAKGDSNAAFDLYAAMKEDDVKPNEFTFASLINACSQEMRVLKKTADDCDTNAQR